MMKNPGNSQKQIWILFTHFNELGVIEEDPCEVFDFKETCFEKYPGRWEKENEDLYFLSNLSNFEKYKYCNSIFLQSFPFTTKSDVTE